MYQRRGVEGRVLAPQAVMRQAAKFLVHQGNQTIQCVGVPVAPLAEQAGDPQRALRALAEAERRQPDEWTLYYLEARLLGPIDPASASRALAVRG